MRETTIIDGALLVQQILRTRNEGLPGGVGWGGGGGVDGHG